MAREFSATFVHEGDWWIGWTDDLRGANAQERTLDEARTSLTQAIADLLLLEEELGSPMSRVPTTPEIVHETLVVDAA